MQAPIYTAYISTCKCIYRCKYIHISKTPTLLVHLNFKYNSMANILTYKHFQVFHWPKSHNSLWPPSGQTISIVNIFACEYIYNVQIYFHMRASLYTADISTCKCICICKYYHRQRTLFRSPPGHYHVQRTLFWSPRGH